LSYTVERFADMSEEEITTNNSMDVDIAPNESSSSPAPPTSTVVLDLGIGSGYISGSDDEEINEPVASKGSTPDSTTLPTTITRKPLTTKKLPLTKTKSSLVNYERDSDDDEHTDEDEEDEDNQDQEGEGDESNSNSAVILHGVGDSDLVQVETTTYTEQTIVTSDMLNVTPFRTEEASPSRGDMTASFPLIFPEDADIRIPPEPTKRCSAKLEEKFEEYYKRFKRTGVDQNARIQELKDFRNPCMYEKMISHLGIDEIGTNFPPELYDPHWWGKESYYEELSKAQKLEMDRS